jgi:glutamate racemase
MLPDLPANKATLPLGIYDSGIGGLTVARAFNMLLPNEPLIYFGDTAHMPYGDKSVPALQSYSIKICDVLLRQPVKAILIACFSASSAAGELVTEYVGQRARVFNVIDPVVDYVANNYAGKKVGLIGTRQTVSSQVFNSRFSTKFAGVPLEHQVELSALATPLLAPMIEEGFVHNNISKEIIYNYLAHPSLNGIEALILACTHYPLIKPMIEAYYEVQREHNKRDNDVKVEVIDSSMIAAASVAQFLKKESLINPSTGSDSRFLVSDFTPAFEASTRLFFGQSVKLEFYPLWN